MTLTMDIAAPKSDRPRIGAIDAARGLALLAMAVYHFTWDLSYFGYVDPIMVTHGGWKLFARAIASSFLVLVGVSLVLAHGGTIRWRRFGIRLLQIAAAAGAITVATYFFSPDSYIFFGILHEIALASVLGLLFLRMPAALVAALASFFVAAPFYLASPVFNHPALWWIGLSTLDPRTNDYVPLFPWFGAVLAGIAVTRIGQQTGALKAASRIDLPTRRLDEGLRFLGRHALAFYLLHQPILFGLVFLFAQMHPAVRPSPPELFGASCEAQCSQTQDHGFCQRFCRCVIDDLQAAKLFDDVYKGRINPQSDPRITGMSEHCSMRAEAK
jgi:uncharacterized membrane protein